MRAAGRLRRLQTHLQAAAASAQEPPGALHPQLVKRGVTSTACFPAPRASVDEVMAMRGEQDVEPKLAASFEPIFDMQADCVRNFDHDKFQRDGFWVWDSSAHPSPGDPRPLTGPSPRPC